MSVCLSVRLSVAISAISYMFHRMQRLLLELNSRWRQAEQLFTYKQGGQLGHVAQSLQPFRPRRIIIQYFLTTKPSTKNRYFLQQNALNLTYSNVKFKKKIL